MKDEMGFSANATGDPRDHQNRPTYIVGIGASAGGLEAIERFFDNMPAQTGMAFVIVQHLSPDFKSLMDELLARHTEMVIHPVKDSMRVEANQVYLIPPRKNMVLSGGRLLLTDQKSDGGLNLPIDVFFDSLAEDAAQRAIAVVLSGTGSDGSRGLQKVHESGGLVLVQSSATAGFDGMPRSAKATGMVDVVTSPSQMPARILQFADHPSGFKRGIDDEDSPEIDEGELGVLFSIFRRSFGIDFNLYRATTINRRIDRRIQMTGCKTLGNYLRRLETDPSEIDVLYRDLLVEVTQFFRDADAFKRIRQEVIPRLLQECPPDGSLRFWVPGCATGEEAYSLAMLVEDCRSEMPDRHEVDVKVFATDVHQRSLEIASAGVYSSDSVSSMPIHYRERYFSRSQDLYHIIGSLRQMVIFAPHDITSDPPFTKIDLISCRNALIYLNSNVQQKAISLFHFGLRVGGVLFLGPSESLGEVSAEFEPIDGQWRIFRKLRDVRLHHSETGSFSMPLKQVVHARPSFVSTATRPDSGWLIPEVHEELLREYVPPSLLVNDRHELVHCFGNARKYLQQPEGKVTIDILRMVSGELRMALSAAIHRAAGSEESVVFKSIPVRVDGGEQRLSIVAKPYKKGSEKLFLICLEPEDEVRPANPEAVAYEADDQSMERIVALERELAYNKESLQATVEELETSNEELQSTNEELVASNEELQSTNEELHSVNEELHTVNSEHQRKIQELTQMTNDMDNMLLSIQIGVIFLDAELRIRKFTPAIGEAFYMLPQDVGRPIEHIASNLDLADLLYDVKSVLANGQMVEREARNRDGRGFLLRIQPYLSKDRDAQGVVLTCVDISKLLTSIDEIRRAAETLELTDRDLQEFAYAVSHDLQAPLRHIANHSRRIREEHAKEFSLDATESLTAINSSVSRLESMIVGLLKYSRVYSRGKPFVETDLDSVLDAAKQKLKGEIEQSAAQITSDPLPKLAVDVEQMTTVFENLLGNAIVYARDMPPIIKVKAQRNGDQWLIDVTDNGIGIAPQHRERVFVIFERLEFRTAPGEGMGLPLCKRIMQRHGGSVSAHANTSGRGSTLRLELPVKIHHNAGQR